MLRLLRPRQGVTKCNTEHHSVDTEYGKATRSLAPSPQCDIISHLLRWRTSVGVVHPLEVHV
jgi:hypothetical protein